MAAQFPVQVFKLMLLPVLAGAAVGVCAGCSAERTVLSGGYRPASAPAPGPSSASLNQSTSERVTAAVTHRVPELATDPAFMEPGEWHAGSDRRVAATQRALDPHNFGATPESLAAARIPGVVFTPDAASQPEETPEGLRQVTTASDGADFDPSVSADGQFLVFASTQHRPTSDIYLKRTDGKTITQLTADPGHDVMPAFSPDGQRVAFASNRRGNWDIFVMSVKGGQPVQVTNDAAHELHPSWSPDGTRLIFCRLGEQSGRWEMWVSEATGGSSSGNEFVGYGLFPSWCPLAGTGENGSDKILFQRSRERGDRAFSIWTIDYRPGDTSSPTEIVSAPGEKNGAALVNAAWSPDGRHIVYASVPGRALSESQGSGATSLWLTDIEGTSRVALTSSNQMNLQPSWSAEGRIYFVSNRTGVSNIWSMTTGTAMAAMNGAPEPDSTETAAVDEESVSGE